MAKVISIRKAGRPKSDYSVEVGVVYGSRLVLSVAQGRDSKSGPVATCECQLCGAITSSRLRDIKAGKSQSCGCLKRESYLDWCRSTLTKLDPDVPMRCWCEHFNGQSRYEISSALGIALPLVDEAIRQYQAEVDALISSGIANKAYLLALEPAGIAGAAKALRLPQPVARYLVQIVARRHAVVGPRELSEADFNVMCAESVLECVALRRDDWTLGPRRNELSPADIRMSKGHVVGMLADLYSYAQAMLQCEIDIHDLMVMTEFTRLVKFTLSARRRRQQSYIARRRRQQAAPKSNLIQFPAPLALAA